MLLLEQSQAARGQKPVTDCRVIRGNGFGHPRIAEILPEIANEKILRVRDPDHQILTRSNGGLFRKRTTAPGYNAYVKSCWRRFELLPEHPPSFLGRAHDMTRIGSQFQRKSVGI